MATVKSIDDIKIKEQLRESDCPACKQGLELVEAYERVGETHDHFRKQAIKKAKERAARIRELEEAASELVHLHMCEMEGLSSGQPTPEEWMDAVDALSEALRKTEKE